MKAQVKILTNIEYTMGGKYMTIIELYTLLLPLINFLGTICLIALVAGGTIFTIVWFAKTFWKQILAVGALSLVAFVVVLVVGAM